MTVIVINPGHAPCGDPDPGAVSINGTREADITAAVGAMVSDYLTQRGHIAPVHQSDSLSEICEFANSAEADLFVSIHCNAAVTDQAHGAETYHASGSVNGERLARAIQLQIIGNLPVTNRGVKEANFYVLKHTDMPAVLVELAFLSNDHDELLLVHPQWQDKFARAIADGITDYIMEVI